MQGAILAVTFGLLLAGSWANGATLTENFETSSGSTPPAGWTYVHSGLGAPGTYSTGVGSDSAGGGAGKGALLVSPNATHGTKLPYSFLVNSTPFDATKPITGSYEFNMTQLNAYSSSGMLFGDILGGGIPGNNGGQLLVAYHAKGGYGQDGAASQIVDGSNVMQVFNKSANTATGVWWRVDFSWTPLANTTSGTFSWTPTRLSNNSTIGTVTAANMVLNNPTAYFGLADLWATDTTFDNVNIVGTIIPEPASMVLAGLGVVAAVSIRRRRR